MLRLVAAPAIRVLIAMLLADNSQLRGAEALTRRCPRTSALTQRAFTLVELIVVIAIIGALSVIVVPPLSSALRSRQLSQASETIASTLSLARQTALAQNRLVEVRFYRYADTSNAGESASNPGSGKYRAVQLFKQSESGTGSVAVGNVNHFPSSIVLDSGTKLSSLFNLTEQSGTVAGYSIPGAQTNYNFVSFRFRPDGSTDLTPVTSLWYLTLHALVYGEPMAQPPNDYSTLQIDAINGKVTSYRP